MLDRPAPTEAHRGAPPNCGAPLERSAIWRAFLALFQVVSAATVAFGATCFAWKGTPSSPPCAAAMARVQLAEQHELEIRALSAGPRVLLLRPARNRLCVRVMAAAGG